MKFPKLVTLWIVLIISVFCQIEEDPDEESRKQKEKQLEYVRQAHAAACCSPNWLIIASSSSLNSKTNPNKDIFAVDASLSHFSAVIECAEEKLKTIKINCTSENNEQYFYNFAVRTYYYHMQILNTDSLSDTDMDMLWQMDEWRNPNAISADIGYVSDEIWYLLSWNPPSNETGLIIVFSKTLLNETGLEIFRSDMLKQFEYFYPSERHLEPFNGRRNGDGRCVATRSTRGGSRITRNQQDQEGSMKLILITSFAIIFLLVLGGFVIRAIVQNKGENVVEKVKTNTRFDCYA